MSSINNPRRKALAEGMNPDERQRFEKALAERDANAARDAARKDAATKGGLANKPPAHSVGAPPLPVSRKTTMRVHGALVTEIVPEAPPRETAQQRRLRIAAEEGLSGEALEIFTRLAPIVRPSVQR